MPRPFKYPKTLTCEHCGEPFERKPQRTKGKYWTVQKPTRFCSGRCRNLYRYLNAPGHIDKNGYRILPQRTKGKGAWRFEHRVVMEQTLGRKLLPHETVHHKNGDRLDNRPDNLELWSSRHGRGQRVSDLMPMSVNDYVLGALSLAA